jgi:hypothetical protein
VHDEMPALARLLAAIPPELHDLALAGLRQSSPRELLERLQVQGMSLRMHASSEEYRELVEAARKELQVDAPPSVQSPTTTIHDAPVLLAIPLKNGQAGWPAITEIRRSRASEPGDTIILPVDRPEPFQLHTALVALLGLRRATPLEPEFSKSYEVPTGAAEPLPSSWQAHIEGSLSELLAAPVATVATLGVARVMRYTFPRTSQL